MLYSKSSTNHVFLDIHTIMGFNYILFDSITIFLFITLWAFIVFIFFIFTLFRIPCIPYILAFIVYVFGIPGCMILHFFIQLFGLFLPYDYLFVQCSYNWTTCPLNVICPGLGAVFYFLVFIFVSNRFMNKK